MHEAAVYRRGSGHTVLLVGVYVDDLIITGADQEVENFKAAMKEHFDMSDLGLLCFYLGVEVRQDAEGIVLRQARYAERILELGGMAGCNPAATPMEEKLRLSGRARRRKWIPRTTGGLSAACGTSSTLGRTSRSRSGS